VARNVSFCLSLCILEVIFSTLVLLHLRCVHVRRDNVFIAWLILCQTCQTPCITSNQDRHTHRHTHTALSPSKPHLSPPCTPTPPPPAPPLRSAPPTPCFRVVEVTVLHPRAHDDGRAESELDLLKISTIFTAYTAKRAAGMRNLNKSKQQ